MIGIRRPLPSVVVLGLAAASLAFPCAALAKGDKTPAPSPDTAPALCDFALDGPTPVGYVFSNQVGDAGCVRVLATTVDGRPTLTLDSVTTIEGWTFTVSSSSSVSVKVLFSNATTGARAEARITPGKTVVK